MSESDEETVLVADLLQPHRDPEVFHLSENCPVDPRNGFDEELRSDVEDDLRLCAFCDQIDDHENSRDGPKRRASPQANALIDADPDAYPDGGVERFECPQCERGLAVVGDEKYACWNCDEMYTRDQLVSDDDRDHSDVDVSLTCTVDGCETEVIGLDDGWEFDRGTVCQDCIDYLNRHGHWPDEDAEICVQCRVDDGMVLHRCDEATVDAHLVEPGEECPSCSEVITDD